MLATSKAFVGISNAEPTKVCVKVKEITPTRETYKFNISLLLLRGSINGSVLVSCPSSGISVKAELMILK